MFEVTAVLTWGEEFFTIFICVISFIQNFENELVLIPTWDAHFGLESSLEIVMCQEKLWV